MKTYFGRGPEAEDAAWAMNHKYGLGKRKTISSPTFLSLVNAYLDAKETDLAASTYDKMVVRMEGTILTNIGDVMALKLSKERIGEYVRKRANEWGQVYIGKDKKQERTFLKTVTEEP